MASHVRRCGRQRQCKILNVGAISSVDKLGMCLQVIHGAAVPAKSRTVWPAAFLSGGVSLSTSLMVGVVLLRGEGRFDQKQSCDFMESFLTPHTENFTPLRTGVRAVLTPSHFSLELFLAGAMTLLHSCRA